MKESGKFIFGVNYEGETFTRFTIREQIVGDAVEVFESEYAERADKSDSFYGVCIMAKRLDIAGIPREAITPDLVMGMDQDDYNELFAARRRLDDRRQRFRSKKDKPAPDPPGPDASGV